MTAAMRRKTIRRGIALVLACGAACGVACNALLDNGEARLVAGEDAGSSSGSTSSSGAPDGLDAAPSSSSSGSIGDGGTSSGAVLAVLASTGNDVVAADWGLFRTPGDGTVVFELFVDSPPRELVMLPPGSTAPVFASALEGPLFDPSVAARAFVLAEGGTLFSCNDATCGQVAGPTGVNGLYPAAEGVIARIDSADSSTLVYTNGVGQEELGAVERGALVAANRTRYFVTAGGGTVLVAPYRGQTGTRQDLALVGTEAISAIAASDTMVFLAGRCSGGAICGLDAANQYQSVAVYGLVSSPLPPVRRLFADEQTLYWTFGGGGTWRCDVGLGCDGSAIRIATVEAEAFSRSSTSVFFVAAGEIYRIDR